jgi:hypothetical protein
MRNLRNRCTTRSLYHYSVTPCPPTIWRHPTQSAIATIAPKLGEHMVIAQVRHSQNAARTTPGNHQGATRTTSIPPINHQDATILTPEYHTDTNRMPPEHHQDTNRIPPECNHSRTRIPPGYQQHASARIPPELHQSQNTARMHRGGRRIWSQSR